MINGKKHRFQIPNNNSGFSLLELLVSIVILMLIMIPLMNNFFQSIKINQKAEKLQDYNSVASNIIEKMKSQDLGHTPTDYTRIYYDADTGTYTTNSSEEEAGIYYYSREGILEGDASYDAIVRVSTGSYLYSAGDSHDGTLMNNYEMPNIITANSNLNAMLFANMYRDSVTYALATTDDSTKDTDKSIDQIALDYFKTAAIAYADAQFRTTEAYTDYQQQVEAYLNGDTEVVPIEPSRSSTPEYCQESMIQTYIDRSFEISLSDVEVSPGHKKSTVNYQITYHCNWPVGVSIGEKTRSFTLESKSYGLQLENMYLYYDIFLKSNISYQTDVIKMTNDTDRAVNFYIVNQDTGVANSPSIKFFRFGSGSTMIYTNMEDSQVKEYTIDAITNNEVPVDETANQATVNNEIISSQKTDRILSIEVEVYSHTAGAIGTKYLTEELYRLTSNRED